MPALRSRLRILILAASLAVAAPGCGSEDAENEARKTQEQIEKEAGKAGEKGKEAAEDARKKAEDAAKDAGGY